MVWDAERIRGLRLRMGWSQNDLARRLEIDSLRVGQLEMEMEELSMELEQSLDLLEKQAQMTADDLADQTLAEILLEEDDATQIDHASVKRRFFNN